MRVLQSQSVTVEPGKSVTLNGLDLIPSEPLTDESVLQAVLVIEQNFGIQYAPEKWTTLAQMVVADGWSDARFRRTCEHFLKTQKYPNWTIADWFAYAVDVHPYAWYLEQVHTHGATVNTQIECYRLDDGTICYRYIDGQTLPFPHKNIRDKEWQP